MSCQIGQVCMSTKSSNEKQAAKNKRVSSGGAGFGITSSTRKPRTSQTNSVQKDSNLSSNKRVEDTTGATGDATPHRVNIENPATALQDPSKELEEETVEPLIELPALNTETVKALRFDYGAELDELIEYFADARQRDDFSAVVVANRHLVTDALLYRFTSAILQVEGRQTETGTKDEEARNMRSLRKDLIAHVWSYDYALKRAVLDAEKRLLEVLKGENVKREVERNCGRSETDVSAFWIVIYAAVAAWEERGRENPELVNVDIQKVLTEAAEAFRIEDRLKDLLNPALLVVQEVLSSADPKKQVSVISEIEDDTIAELCCLTEAVRLLPSQAYGGLAERMTTIVNYIRTEKYGLPPLKGTPFRFNLSEIVRDSPLIEFSIRAAKSRRL